MNTLTNAIPVTKAVLDTDAVSRQKIEAANRAVLDAAYHLYQNNPSIAANLFGAEPEILKQMIEMKKSDVLKLTVTGVPLFVIRLAKPEFSPVLNNTPDAIFSLLLQSFSAEVPLSSL